MNEQHSARPTDPSHTPGPWTIEDPIEFELAIVEANKPTHEWKFIAMISHSNEEESDFSPAVALANARLIAAAPDLLEAAEEVLKHFMPSFPDSRAVDDCLVQLAAAVAKAAS